jgi:hypothetical protein
MRTKAMVKKIPLTLVGADRQAAPTPPTNLDEAGLTLWRSVMAEYGISDSGGLVMLEQAARALDRAADCAAQIARDGSVLVTKLGMKDHPLLRHESTNRALAVRILARLGLDLEPLQPRVGRPATGHGISWKQFNDK